jgi:hypothetical protein
MTPEFWSILAAISAILAIIAGGAALYVSMSVKGALSSFQVKLMQDLDQRYVPLRQYEQNIQRTGEEEDHYRENIKEKMDVASVECYRIRDAANEIRDIVAIIKIKAEKLK